MPHILYPPKASLRMPPPSWISYGWIWPDLPCRRIRSASLFAARACPPVGRPSQLPQPQQDESAAE